jgi:hypothetical protein
MHEARIWPNGFREIGQEGENVMARFFFDFIDALQIPFALFPDIPGGGSGDDAKLRQSVAGMGFDFEPDAHPVVGIPDLGHFRAGIARNH